jgi:hypothetical protein
MTTRPKLIGLVLLGLGLATAIAVLLITRQDGPSFDDSDLKPNRLYIPVSSNAFTYLQQATKRLDWPEARESELKKLMDGKAWDSQLAAELLEDNTETLELLHKASGMAALQIPEVKSFDEDHEYLSAWRGLVRLEVVRARNLFRAGKAIEAFDSALRILQFGHQVEECGGLIIHFLVGSSIKEAGLLEIRGFLTNTTLSDEQMAVYMKTLGNLRVNETGLTNSFKVEYGLFVREIQKIASGQALGANSPLAQMGNAVATKASLSLPKTMALTAELYRACLAAIATHKSRVPPHPFDQMSTNRSVFRKLIGGNMTGEILVDMSKASLEAVLNKKCRENTSVAATQLLIALRCYHRQHGKLPESLDALVPEYLPAVPLDDFDGKPLRYLPAKKLIYSIGDNLKDDGGKAEDEKKKSLDRVFAIDF